MASETCEEAGKGGVTQDVPEHVRSRRSPSGPSAKLGRPFEGGLHKRGCVSDFNENGCQGTAGRASGPGMVAGCHPVSSQCWRT